VLAWRLDVGANSLPSAFPCGFDAYFFDTRILPIDDAGFSIGEPWWDLWFPVACEMNGAKIEVLSLPIITHEIHSPNWHEQTWASRRLSLLEEPQAWACDRC
jgi:hypothetical protein